MKNKEVVQKEILRRKINEFFSKNPSKKTAMFKTESFGNKFYWKVDKKKKGFVVKEVKTIKDDFVIEANNDGDDDDWDKMATDNLPKTPFRDIDFADKTVNAKKSGTNIEPPPAPELVVAKKPTGIGKVKAAIGKQVGRQVRGIKKKINAVQKNISAQQQKRNIEQQKRSTINAMQWNPSGQDSQSKFNRTLTQTKSLQKALTAIPQGDFQGVAGFTGAKNANELLRDRQKMSKFLQHHGQFNPLLKKFSESFNRAVLRESAEFGRMSTEFTKSMQFPLNHQKLSAALRLANSIIGRLTDAKEKADVGTMIGVLTNLVDSTTNQMSTGKTTISSGKAFKGKQLKEATKEDDQNEIPNPKKKEKAAVDLDKMLPGKDDKEPEGVEDTHVDDTEESTAELPPSQDMNGEKEISPEQKVISDKLGGQSIEDVNLEFATDAVNIKLQLVGMKNPAILQVFKSGKVKFIYKGRPYLVKNE